MAPNALATTTSTSGGRWEPGMMTAHPWDEQYGMLTFGRPSDGEGDGVGALVRLNNRGCAGMPATENSTAPATTAVDARHDTTVSASVNGATHVSAHDTTAEPSSGRSVTVGSRATAHAAEESSHATAPQLNTKNEVRAHGKQCLPKFTPVTKNERPGTGSTATGTTHTVR